MRKWGISLGLVVIVAFATMLLWPKPEPILVQKLHYGVQTKTTHCIANQALPDPDCSPGDVLTTSTSTICASGYAGDTRDVSVSLKKRVFAEYDIPYDQHSNYEVDHIISLELGGSNDISNLYPESYSIAYGAREKDKFENYLHRQVCKGIVAAEEAQRKISTDWVKNYRSSQIE